MEDTDDQTPLVPTAVVTENAHGFLARDLEVDETLPETNESVQFFAVTFHANGISEAGRLARQLMKDTECVFGILKIRWRFLKNAIEI